MPFRIDDNVISLDGHCSVEEAQPLFEALRGVDEPIFDLDAGARPSYGDRPTDPRVAGPRAGRARRSMARRLLPRSRPALTRLPRPAGAFATPLRTAACRPLSPLLRGERPSEGLGD